MKAYYSPALGHVLALCTGFRPRKFPAAGPRVVRCASVSRASARLEMVRSCWWAVLKRSNPLLADWKRASASRRLRTGRKADDRVRAAVYRASGVRGWWRHVARGRVHHTRWSPTGDRWPRATKLYYRRKDVERAWADRTQRLPVHILRCQLGVPGRVQYWRWEWSWRFLAADSLRFGSEVFGGASRLGDSVERAVAALRTCLGWLVSPALHGQGRGREYRWGPHTAFVRGLERARDAIEYGAAPLDPWGRAPYAPGYLLVDVCRSPGLELQRDDSAGVFADDNEAAVAFVYDLIRGHSCARYIAEELLNTESE